MDKNKQEFATLKRELKIRNYSPRTLKSYVYYNKKLLTFCDKSARDVGVEDIKEYLGHLADSNSSSTVSLALNAVKFYYKMVYKRSFFVRIPSVKKNRRLPVVLSIEEVGKILKNSSSSRHYCMISLSYGAGLRISELVCLRMQDIDFNRNIVYICQGKGGKDRIVPLPERLVDILLKQANLKTGKDFVFTNRVGHKLTTRTISKIVSDSVGKAGILKKVTPHSFRHSYATHLLESGVDIRYIQELLGHKRIETTQMYTKVASSKLQKIKSPLDRICSM